MPATKRNLALSQLKVGIFIIIGLIVFGFLVINSTGDFNPFESKVRLKARFLNADGLREGSEVRLAGVNIGRVTDVALLPFDSPEDAKIEAIFSVISELDGKPIVERIRSDSTAQLVATSVLGNDKMINITPGTPEGTRVLPNHVLNSSAAISINQLTETGNDLLGQINKLAIPANEILNKANQGDGTLGRIINDEALYRTLDTTVSEAKLSMLKIQTLLDRVKSGEGTVGKLVNDPELYNNLSKTVAGLEQISSDLKDGKGTAGKFLTEDAFYNDTKSAINEIRATMRSIKPTLDNINGITNDLSQGNGTVGKLLKDEQLYELTKTTIARLNSTTQKFETMLTNAQNGRGTIGRLVTDETLYNNLNKTTSNINQLSSESTKLIYDFRQNPKKFLSIKLKLF